MEPHIEVVIDADGLVYAAGFAANDEPLINCLSTVKKMIQNIKTATNADNATLLLTGKGNFREEVATLQKYKGNREGAEKPVHYEDIRKYLVKHHNATVVDGMEADDAVGMLCSSDLEGTVFILSSADKDLKMIPGQHYNWQKQEWYEVKEREGFIFFLHQLLTGDSGDNIPGLFRLTKTKASAKMKNTIEQEVLHAGDLWKEVGLQHVTDIYAMAIAKADGHSDTTESDYSRANEIIRELGNLLWIRRKPNQTFLEYVYGASEEEG